MIADYNTCVMVHAQDGTKRDVAIRATDDAATIGELVIAAIKGSRLFQLSTMVRCPVHGDMVHGREAEQLRKGVEKILQGNFVTPSKMEAALRALLDRVDARDSLAYLERRGRK